MLMTTHGERKLLGHERRLFAAGVLSLLELIEANSDWVTGVIPFDRIPEEERPRVLLHVAGRFLDDRPAPVPTAWLEATVLAVYEHIRSDLVVEIDTEDELYRDGVDPGIVCQWRTLILLAWCERCCDPTENYAPSTGPNQPVSSLDHEEWTIKLNALDEEVLDDRDCVGEIAMDIDPERASEVYDHLGIPRGYYRAAAPVLDARQINRLHGVRKRLLEIDRGSLGRAAPGSSKPGIAGGDRARRRKKGA